MDIIEDFAPAQGLTWSKACALLIEEALTARGLVPGVRIPDQEIVNHIGADMEDALRREVTATKRGWVPSQGLEAMEEMTPEWNDGNATIQQESPPSNTTSGAPLRAADEAQLMKLKLMQELMDQLKAI